MIQLRGHHLFCLVGFRGMGYSEEFANNMKKVYHQIQSNPNTPIQIINGPDCLCEKFPDTEKYHCKDKNIFVRDSTILKLLKLQVGQIITWGEIEKKIANFITPSTIHTICSTCPWKEYGVCEEGIQRIKEGKGLVKVKLFQK